MYVKLQYFLYNTSTCQVVFLILYHIVWFYEHTQNNYFDNFSYWFLTVDDDEPWCCLLDDDAPCLV